MTIATLRQQLGLETPQVKLLEGPASDFLPEDQIVSADLVNSIKDGTVTVGQIDSFLQEKLSLLPASKQQRAHVFLLSRKAWLVSQEGKLEEALRLYDQALRIAETPSTWASKGIDLWHAERLDEAFDSFRKSYSLREDFGPQKQAHLKNLIGAWSVAALLRGLSGILEQDLPEAEKGVFEYIELLDKARADNVAHMVLNLAVEQPVPEDIRAGLEELELMVRLLSIKDPFEGWWALSKEISKVWPKGVSAVDAIREQRDR